MSTIPVFSAFFDAFALDRMRPHARSPNDSTPTASVPILVVSPRREHPMPDLTITAQKFKDDTNRSFHTRSAALKLVTTILDGIDESANETFHRVHPWASDRF